MQGWLTVLGLWGSSALICLPAVTGGPTIYLAVTLLVLFMGFSAYLYSPRFTDFVDALLRHTRSPGHHSLTIRQTIVHRPHP
jgi:hypothetical protein